MIAVVQHGFFDSCIPYPSRSAGGLARTDLNHVRPRRRRRTRPSQSQPDAHRTPLARDLGLLRERRDRLRRDALVLQFMPFCRRIARGCSTPRPARRCRAGRLPGAHQGDRSVQPGHGNAFATFAAPNHPQQDRSQLSATTAGTSTSHGACRAAPSEPGAPHRTGPVARPAAAVDEIAPGSTRTPSPCLRR